MLISPLGTFASQYWKLFFAMRVRAPLHKLMRRLTGNHRPPSLNDLRKRPIAAMPRDAKWSQQMAVTMTERPRGAIVPNADHIAAMAEPEDVDGRIIVFVRAIRSDVT